MNHELKKSNPKLYDKYFDEIPIAFKSISSDFLVSATDMDIVDVDGKPFLQMVSRFYSPKHLDSFRLKNDPVEYSQSCTLMAELDENKKLTGKGVTISADSYGTLPTSIDVKIYGGEDNGVVYMISSADKTTFYNVADRSQISKALSIQRSWEKKEHTTQAILDNIDKYIKPNKIDSLAAKAYADGREFGKNEHSPEYIEKWQEMQKQIATEKAQVAADEKLIENETLNIEGHVNNFEHTVKLNSEADFITNHAQYWGKLMQIEMKRQNLDHLTPEIAKDTAHRANMKFGLSAYQFFASHNCLSVNWKYGQELAEIYIKDPSEIQAIKEQRNAIQDKDSSTRLGKLRKRIARGVDKVTEATGAQKIADAVFHKDIRTEPIKMGEGVKNFEKNMDKIIDNVMSNKKIKE